MYAILLIGIAIVFFFAWAGAHRPTAEPFTATPQNSRRINIYNEYHLGDAIFTMIYINNIADYLHKNNITINLYINSKYISETSKFITNNNVKLLPLEEKPADSYNIWIGNYFDTYKNGMSDVVNNFNDFIVHVHNLFGKHMQLPEIENLEYNDPDLNTRYNNLSDEYKHVDILFINSIPNSGQYNYNKDEWDALIKRLAKKYKVVTTLKVDGVPCTMDANYSLKDIAAISTHANYIIGINTGPLIGCFNTQAIKYAKRWFIFDDINHFNMPHITHLETLDQLDEYFP